MPQAEADGDDDDGDDARRRRRRPALFHYVCASLSPFSRQLSWASFLDGWWGCARRQAFAWTSFLDEQVGIREESMIKTLMG